MRKIIKTEFFDIEYELTLKKIKNIILKVDENADVLVSAPQKANISDIEKFIIKKADWIVKSKQKIQNKISNRHFPQKFESGESIDIFGEIYNLKIINSEIENIYIEGNFFVISSKNIDDRQKIKEKALDYLVKILNNEIIKMSIDIFDKFSRYSISMPTIKLRQMKSRWGSCMPSKNSITFSKSLVFKPKPCIRYVVIHEFAHLIVPNHSKKFYDIVSEFEPDYISLRRKLNS